MAFLSEIKNKISQTTQNAVKGTKSMADTVKLNALITDEEKLISERYQQIGKLYYELYSTQPSEEIFAPACTAITESMDRIAGYRKEIQEIKGIKICTNCGAGVPTSTSFCSVCGCAMHKDVAAEIPTQNRTCPSCNNEVETKMTFCSNCGSKL